MKREKNCSRSKGSSARFQSSRGIKRRYWFINFFTTVTKNFKSNYKSDLNLIYNLLNHTLLVALAILTNTYIHLANTSPMCRNKSKAK